MERYFRKPITNEIEKSTGAVLLPASDMSQIPASADWPMLTTVGVIISYRKEKGKVSKELNFRYYISSATLTAEELAASAREHWNIENGLHWKLDGVPQAHRIAA